LVLSISWGTPEAAWTGQALQAFDQAFRDAAAFGVTVCCASGDNESGDGLSDGKAHVDFPVASPYVLACGGTGLLRKCIDSLLEIALFAVAGCDTSHRRLEATGMAISSEVVWNDAVSGGATGGGVSDVFPLPDWQWTAHVPGQIPACARVR